MIRNVIFDAHNISDITNYPAYMAFNKIKISIRTPEYSNIS